MQMAEMYFSCSEKEKGLALFARLDCTEPVDIPPSSTGIDALLSEMDSAIEVLDTNAMTAAVAVVVIRYYSRININ